MLHMLYIWHITFDMILFDCYHSELLIFVCIASYDTLDICREAPLGRLFWILTWSEVISLTVKFCVIRLKNLRVFIHHVAVLHSLGWSALQRSISNTELCCDTSDMCWGYYAHYKKYLIYKQVSKQGRGCIFFKKIFTSQLPPSVAHPIFYCTAWFHHKIKQKKVL